MDYERLHSIWGSGRLARDERQETLQVFESKVKSPFSGRGLRWAYSPGFVHAVENWSQESGSSPEAITRNTGIPRDLSVYQSRVSAKNRLIGIRDAESTFGRD